MKSNRENHTGGASAVSRLRLAPAARMRLPQLATGSQFEYAAD